MGKVEVRRQVIENIRSCISAGQLNGKVEPGDPVLTQQQKKALVDKNIDHQRIRYRMGNLVARRMANTCTRMNRKSIEIAGMEKLQGIHGGIITSNHFSPLDNTAVRQLVLALGKKKLFIVSQDSNLGMKGIVGFLMRCADTIPMSKSRSYMANVFPEKLQACLQNDFVLIYPEEEMWYNYRKPRPLRRGAYYYAAALRAPVISCFVEIIDDGKDLKREFGRVRYRLHVLEPIWPDPEKSVRENSFEMCERDYRQKKAAYERIYHQPLSYEFQTGDIAGWHPCRQ
ncbi:MAG: 1-acyl-sn-glycerol-3-phosphate acyltransferase [Anaerovoracaceae bacterium]